MKSIYGDVLGKLSVSEIFTIQGVPKQEIMPLYLIVLDIFFIREFLKLFFDECLYLESAAFCQKELCILTVQIVKVFLSPPACFIGCSLVF